VDPGDRVRRLFTPLVSLPLSAQRRLWISLAPGWALLWPGATWMSLGDIEAFFDFARAFRGSIPRHLREDHPV
jgi:hypothetical protein